MTEGVRVHSTSPRPHAPSLRKEAPVDEMLAKLDISADASAVTKEGDEAEQPDQGEMIWWQWNGKLAGVEDVL